MSSVTGFWLLGLPVGYPCCLHMQQPLLAVLESSALQGLQADCACATEHHEHQHKWHITTVAQHQACLEVNNETQTFFVFAFLKPHPSSGLVLQSKSGAAQRLRCIRLFLP